MREIIELNWEKFSIFYLKSNEKYIISQWDGEEFLIPYTRYEFKTRKWALNRIQELAGVNK